MDEEKIHRLLCLLIDADNLPRIQKPKHINIGVSWTTKESNDLHTEMHELIITMTRDEGREAIRRHEEYKKQEIIRDSQREAIGQLEKYVKTMCQKTEETSGVKVRDISFDRMNDEIFVWISYEQYSAR